MSEKVESLDINCEEVEEQQPLPNFSNPKVLRAFRERQARAMEKDLEAWDQAIAESKASAWGYVIVY